MSSGDSNSVSFVSDGDTIPSSSTIIIIAVAVGALVIAVLLAVGIFCLVRSKQREQDCATVTDLVDTPISRLPYGEIPASRGGAEVSQGEYSELPAVGSHEYVEVTLSRPSSTGTYESLPPINHSHEPPQYTHGPMDRF
jgi:hypothetical protein